MLGRPHRHPSVDLTPTLACWCSALFAATVAGPRAPSALDCFLISLCGRGVLLSCGKVLEQRAIDHPLPTRDRPTHWLPNGAKKDSSRPSSPSLRGPPIHFSAVRNGNVTHRRHLAEALPPTNLAQSACPLTSTSHECSATACSVMQPRHHCCDVEQTQHVCCGAAVGVAAQLTNTKPRAGQLDHHRSPSRPQYQ